MAIALFEQGALLNFALCREELFFKARNVKSNRNG
jgi:hypothetical protein